MFRILKSIIRTQNFGLLNLWCKTLAVACGGFLLRRIKDLQNVSLIPPIQIEPITPFLLTYVKRNDVFVDIGANIGNYTEMMAIRGCVVYAFEPNPLSFKVLQDRTRSYPFVHCYNVALSDRCGIAKLYYGAPFRASLLLNEGKTFAVKCRTLDSYNLKPDWIKIDVEGHEYEVILGLLKTLRKHMPNLAIEFHTRDNFRKISVILRSLGYQTWIVSEKPTATYPIDIIGYAICYRLGGGFNVRTSHTKTAHNQV